MSQRVTTKADEEVRECLAAKRSFALVAGAGSGKTTSLIDALEYVRAKEGATLRRNGQRVACITYTKRAVGVIKARLGFDDLYLVSTIHSFVWGELGRFQYDIRESLRVDRVPLLIAKARERDNGGSSRQARRAREQDGAELCIEMCLGALAAMQQRVPHHRRLSLQNSFVRQKDEVALLVAGN